MAGRATTAPTAPGETSVVTIAPAGTGYWRVSTTDDRLGGLFVTRKAAVAFAREEARATSHRTILVEDALQRGEIHVQQRRG